MNSANRCAGRVWQNHYYYPCSMSPSLNEDGKLWCKRHAPSTEKKKREKSDQITKYREEAWKLESKERDAENAVMEAARNVYRSQIGAGWDAEQQRKAVEDLVGAVGSLEAVEKKREVHRSERPQGLRKV